MVCTTPNSYQYFSAKYFIRFNEKFCSHYEHRLSSPGVVMPSAQASFNFSI
jgi:hypothetical protein